MTTARKVCILKGGPKAPPPNLIHASYRPEERKSMVRRWPAPLMVSTLMIAAMPIAFEPGASAQATRAADESFFIEKVYPTLHALQCERCHSDNGVASE